MSDIPESVKMWCHAIGSLLVFGVCTVLPAVLCVGLLSLYDTPPLWAIVGTVAILMACPALTVKALDKVDDLWKEWD